MSGMRGKILIVCPDPRVVKVVQALLDKAGYRVLVTSLGQDALELAGSECPDLIVIERMLPDLSGLALVRLIRSQEKTHQLPIVLIGPGLKDEEMMLALEAGADLCLKEPLHPSVFTARVRALLRRCHLYAFP